MTSLSWYFDESDLSLMMIVKTMKVIGDLYTII
ncbi:hypothetical protein PTE_03993 [Photorhabdus khanii NC19]|uniref:Uncharacterized protein n=1 Tax=Photorhabdus khanii NC19 TaxID=1004151 RepID=W3V3F9_9GAMM|nr:hypothetical protein PTE_03993 [Photorhabdus khanii NC19]